MTSKKIRKERRRSIRNEKSPLFIFFHCAITQTVALTIRGDTIKFVASAVNPIKNRFIIINRLVEATIMYSVQCTRIYK